GQAADPRADQEGHAPGPRRPLARKGGGGAPGAAARRDLRGHRRGPRRAVARSRRRGPAPRWTRPGSPDASAVGVLGGTFDPVHPGPRARPAGVRGALGLAQVLLVPCPVPPHKPERAVTAAYHRLEMLYLGCEGRERLAVGTEELARGGVS